MDTVNRRINTLGNIFEKVTQFSCGYPTFVKRLLATDGKRGEKLSDAIKRRRLVNVVSDENKEAVLCQFDGRVVLTDGIIGSYFSLCDFHKFVMHEAKLNVVITMGIELWFLTRD